MGIKAGQVQYMILLNHQIMNLYAISHDGMLRNLQKNIIQIVIKLIN